MCKAAPIPGETRTWQYITLFKRIFLIDCPGVVYGNVELPASASAAADSSLVALENETTAVLKGVVRIDNLEEPAQYADGVLSRVKTEYLRRTYGIASWTDSTDFLEQLARQSGRLLKGGETDVNTAARMLLNDWQRGRLPYFVCPPFEAEVQQQEQAEEAERKRREEQRRLKVEQMYSKIAVRVQFNEEDSRGPAAQQQTELEVGNEQQPQDGQEEAAGRQEETKDWDSVYADMQGEEVDNDEAQRLLSVAQNGEEEPAEEEAKEGEEEEIVAEVRADSKPTSRKRRALSEADAEEDEVEAEEGGGESAHRPAARAAAARLSSPQPSSNGDTRPRSKKNKSRSKKKKKEASRKAKRGRPAA